MRSLYQSYAVANAKRATELKSRCLWLRICKSMVEGVGLCVAQALRVKIKLQITLLRLYE